MKDLNKNNVFKQSQEKFRNNYDPNKYIEFEKEELQKLAELDELKKKIKTSIKRRIED